MPSNAPRRPAKKKAGRPRTRPTGNSIAGVPLSATERAAVSEAAAMAGLSAAQWMRRELLRAAAR